MDALDAFLIEQARFPAHARMYLTTTTGNFTGGVEFTVPFDTVDYDPLSMCTTGASAKFTVPYAGYYLVSAQVLWNVNNLITAGAWLVDFQWISGSITQNIRTTPQFSTQNNINAQNPAINGSVLLPMQKSDTVAVLARQTSATAMSLLGNTGDFNYATITFMAPL